MDKARLYVRDADTRIGAHCARRLEPGRWRRGRFSPVDDVGGACLPPALRATGCRTSPMDPGVTSQRAYRVLDTNVLSGLWTVEPSPDVLVWIDGQAVETLYLMDLRR